MRTHTDIASDGWIAKAPASWAPFILLSGQPLQPTIRLILLFAAGSIVMRAAGCVVNDLWDRDIDRQVTRTAGRPLASGALSSRQALVFLGVLLLLGLTILLQLNLL